MSRAVSTGRRDFLSVTLLAGGALAFGIPLPGCARRPAAGGGARGPAVAVSVWLKVARDGRITFVNPQAEMGQGAWSSLAMVFADEFGAAWDATDIEAGGVLPEFRLNPYVKEVFTAGSGSITMGYVPVRTAAAAAREMFLMAAAARLGTSVADLRLENSRVVARNGSGLGIGELVDDVAKLKPPVAPKLKPDAELRFVGKGVPAKDIPDKVTGATIFGIDYHEPGMLVATVKCSPVHGGIVVRSNAEVVGKMPGVTAVLAVPSGLAVVADTFWRAKKALDALEVEFDARAAERVDDASLAKAHAAAIRRTDGVVGFDDGDTLGKLAGATRVHEAAYAWPWLAHAQMEPLNCTVRVTADRADVWVGTQGIEYTRNEVARVTELPPERVHVHNLMLGGAFGRRYEADVPVQAATIARALPGKTVKVIWTREEDIQQDFYRPAGAALMRASLGTDGLPEALLVRVSAPSIAAHNPGFAHFAKPVDMTAIDGFAGLHYEVPNRRFEWIQAESHLRIGWWRSVGNSHNAFVKECFIDELAEAARVDPLEYRLRLLTGDKHAPVRRLLTELARAANWGQAPKGRAQGLALHDTLGTMVGEVVELSVAGQDLHVHRITCAYDCGIVVNPGPVDAQLRGSIVWALTAALQGEINIDRGRVRQSNFHDYPLLYLAETPEIELLPVLRGGAPTGTGEPAVSPLAPALANALYRATGQRLRQLPLSRAGFRLLPRQG